MFNSFVAKLKILLTVSAINFKCVTLLLIDINPIRNSICGIFLLSVNTIINSFFLLFSSSVYFITEVKTSGVKSFFIKA